MQLFLFTEIKHKREEVTEELTDRDLSKVIEIDLSETDTIWLLDMSGVCVAADSDEAPMVREQNDRYNEVGHELLAFIIPWAGNNLVVRV